MSASAMGLKMRAQQFFGILSAPAVRVNSKAREVVRVLDSPIPFRGFLRLFGFRLHRKRPRSRRYAAGLPAYSPNNSLGHDESLLLSAGMARAGRIAVPRPVVAACMFA